MDDAERLLVIGLAVEAARGTKAKVVAGTGSNNTAATIDFTRKAREAGADGALVVAPYYNRPTQEGMFAHFGEIAKSVKKFPIMLYNVPSRTASNISAETTLKLAEKFDNIVATKEASGNFSQIMEINKTVRKVSRCYRATMRAPCRSLHSGPTGLCPFARMSCRPKRLKWWKRL